MIRLVLISILLFINLSLRSQGVTVNNDGSSANSSAILDVNSIDRGFLLPRQSTAQRDQLSNPARGLIIYNLTTHEINTYNGEAWVRYDFKCSSFHVTTANAGADQLIISGTTATLQGNAPNIGNGQWSIIQGSGGNITSPASPTSGFTGNPETSYTLRWTIISDCALSLDDVKIDFCTSSAIADAGPDQLNIPSPSTILQGNTPTAGTGQWSIISGTGGNVVEHSNPSSLFLGLSSQCYTLMWTVSLTCTTITDEVMISFLCFPQPNQANAGPDQVFLPGPSTILEGNTPTSGTGQWSIISGTGGNIAEPMNPASSFSGLSEGSYTLRWSITTSCTTSTDDVNISFNCFPQPTEANAGADQIHIPGPTTTLQGNTPTYGTGHWTITSGIGGGIEHPYWPNSNFTGGYGVAYTLKWKITNDCGTNSDYVDISFQCTPQPTQANAGPDQIGIEGPSTTLQGNIPTSGTGHWSIVSGTGGNVTNPSSPTSTFTGLSEESYTLEWTITACEESTDDVDISFICFPQPTMPNAGPDQINVLGATATLQGNTPSSGTGAWSIMSGSGGTIISPSDPVSQFTGTWGSSYTLRWTISNSCATNHDDVLISFATFTCNYSFKDNRDNKVYNTVQIGTQCWMQQNLNYSMSGSGSCYNNQNSNCNVYGRLYDWATATTVCSPGFHLPSNGEWCTLSTYLDNTVTCGNTGWLGTDAGGKMKETGTTHWNSPNTGATNSSSFTALPGGYNDGSYGGLNTHGYFWTNSASGSNAYSWYMQNSEARINRVSYNKNNEISVRCVKN